MSASREKKTRQDQVSTGWVNPKTSLEAEKLKAEKRSNAMYIAIAVAFVAVAVITLVWRSGIVQKKAVAVTVNGENYTAAEVSYYYHNVYQNFISQNYYYLSYLGLDTSKSLKEQSYGSDGETWFDYFAQQAVDQMAHVQALNEAAAKEGFTWTDELQQQLDDSIAEGKSSAASSGYTFKQYLTAVYGSTMTESVYKAQLKNTMLAQAYCDAYTDSLNYTDDQLEEAYNADKASYDVVDYQSLRVDGSVATTDADGNTVDVTDEMKADAMAEAKTTADKLYASYKAGASLESLGSDEVTYTNGEAASNSSSALMTWLFDDSRKAGDSAVVEDESGSAYYVVSFGKRYRQEYNTVDVRHILIQPASGTLSEGDDGYQEEQDKLKADAKQKAEDILAQWKAGEATEDSFAELAKENSADGNASEGGIYTQVAKGTMVDTFNDWIFDASRQPGDTGIVETTYGYHVMYFVGQDLPYWKVQVTNALKDQDFNTWYTEKTDGYTGEMKDSGMKYVG